MISLIICSKNDKTAPVLMENIQTTIGTEYEIIHIDNSQRKYNIFEAYNLGVQHSKGEHLCFMHEDIRFCRKNWGQVIEHALSREEVGALGVAGGHAVLGELDWRFYGFGHVYLRQGTTSIEPHPVYYISYEGDEDSLNGELQQVAAIDGVWMCMRKELFKNIRFDDQHFHDFHLYDSDISMQINMLGKGVFITDEVFLEHQSEGTFSEGYRDSLNIFFQKWGATLPIVKGNTLAQEKIDKTLPTAHRLFEERLKKDALTIGIRQLLQQQDVGKTIRSFTPEEEALMEQSAFTARKKLIKDKSLSNAVVWARLKDYLHYSFAHRKSKLILKYIWYRFII